jgi:molybdopterin-synthase adenylyltransferase
MNYSVALQESTNALVKDHLLREDGQEDLCFAFYSYGSGINRITGIINDVILPEDGDRNLHGNVSFNPQYFDKVTETALKLGKGIVFIHSHPGKGWQGMSKDDINTEQMLAPRVKTVTKIPLIGMTIGSDGIWSARFWPKTGPNEYARQTCESVRIVGKSFSISFDPKLLNNSLFKRDEFLRTVSAWGEKQQISLSCIKVGIVGIGSVGSQIAEGLLRTGIQNITLIDFDLVEKKNLDRLHGIRHGDIGYLKTDIFSRLLTQYKLLPTQSIRSIPYSIIEENGFNSAVDCDILFCCVDRPWPRFVLNCISYAYLIPIIDGGIDASYSIKSDNLDYARWRAYTVGPGRRCMKCMEQYKPEDVSLEQSGLLEDSKYIQGLPDDHFSKRGENVYIFSLSLAGLLMQQFLSLILRPKRVYYGPKEMDFVTGNVDAQFKFNCDYTCEFSTLTGQGDSLKNTLIQPHRLAELSRLKAKKLISQNCFNSKVSALKVAGISLIQRVISGFKSY